MTAASMVSSAAWLRFERSHSKYTTNSDVGHAAAMGGAFCLCAMAVPADRFVMVGNSMRSDIVPILRLGGWGVHVPYHLTWAHENEADDVAGHPRLRQVADAGGRFKVDERRRGDVVLQRQVTPLGCGQGVGPPAGGLAMLKGPGGHRIFILVKHKAEAGSARRQPLPIG